MSSNILVIVAVVLLAWDIFDGLSGHILSKWIADLIKEVWKRRQAKLREKRWNAYCKKHAGEIVVIPWEDIE